MSKPPIVVAIDGPAGSGKSTVARVLAQRLGLPFLDTGAMYRALALLALEREVDPDNSGDVSALLADVKIELRIGADGGAEVLLAGEPVESRIRTPEVSAATSRLAVHSAVREKMVRLQRELAVRHGGVIEGRDIGTRVVPETRFKFFLRADSGVRAERRLADLRAAGRSDLEAATVESELRARDARDEERPLSPLVAAPDAVVVDTTALTIEEVVGVLAGRIALVSGSSAE